MNTTVATQKQKAVQAWVKLPANERQSLPPSPPSTARSPALKPSALPRENLEWGRAHSVGELLGIGGPPHDRGRRVSENLTMRSCKGDDQHG